MFKRKIWLIVHHEKLLDIDRNLIGFKEVSEWNQLSEENIVIYYGTRFAKIIGV